MPDPQLGQPLHPAWPTAFGLTSLAASRGVAVPAGALLNTPHLTLAQFRARLPGDLGAGELLDLRSATLRDRPALGRTAAELHAALPDCWDDGGLLLTPAVAAVHGGTARLRRPADSDPTDSDPTDCDAVVAFELTPAGRASGDGGRALAVPRLGRWQRAHRGGDPWRTPLPPWGMRLARLLREVRPLADGGTLEWADDGHRCWLLLLHPAD